MANTIGNYITQATLACIYSKKFCLDQAEYLERFFNYIDETPDVLIMKEAYNHTSACGEALGDMISDRIADRADAFRLSNEQIDYYINIYTRENYEKISPVAVVQRLKTTVERVVINSMTSSSFSSYIRTGDVDKFQDDLRKLQKELAPASTIDVIDGSKDDIISITLEAVSDDGLEKRREFSHGVKHLDMVGFRPERQTLCGILGLKGIGKTHFIILTGGYNLVHNNAKVAIFNIEGPGKNIAQRVGTYVTGLDHTILPTSECIITPNRSGYVTKDSIKTIVTPPGIKVSDLKKEQLEKLYEKTSRIFENLKIFTFRPGEPTPNSIDNVLDTHAQRGWVPDIVLVDHLANFKLPNDKDKRTFALLEYSQDFLGISMDYNCSFNYAHQPSGQENVVRTGGFLTFDKNSSGARAIVQDAQRLITLNGTDAEAQLGLYRLYIEKSRTPLPEAAGSVGKMILVSNNYIRGRYATSSGFFSPSTQDMFDKTLEKELGGVKKPGGFEL